MAKDNHVWCIALINTEFLHLAKGELKKSKLLQGVKVYIPTVKILVKNFKGKPHFDYVPLLFNYGFFKLTPQLAANAEFLEKIKEQVSCVSGWAKDPTKVINAPHIKYRSTETDEVIEHSYKISQIKEERYKSAPIALATAKEIKAMVEAEKDLSIHSADELKSLKVGTHVTLRGKPFDGFNAIIEEIDFVTRKVSVSIGTGDILKSVPVDFQNVYYTIYNGGFDDSQGREEHLEDLKTMNRVNKIRANF